MDASSARRRTEIELLQAGYPEEVRWNKTRQELTYKPEGGILTLRLPDDYPGKGTPELVSATSKDKTDLRALTRSQILALELCLDQEALDAIIQAFDELLGQTSQASQEPDLPIEQCASKSSSNLKCKTIIIWLHHLLNTNKRKLALAPGMSLGAIGGITKPGYPGVLVYSGDSDVVQAHVAELRNQRWQAFQIRFDEVGELPWKFNTVGVVEVQTMSEVTKNIADENNRQIFLKAIGVK